MGDQPSVALAERMDAFDLSMGRLKTGTPPRLERASIAWDRLENQPGDDEPTMFSFLSGRAGGASGELWNCPHQCQNP